VKGVALIANLALFNEQLAASRTPTALDLDELRLADVDAVRFLAAAERQGVVLRHCAPFIREWMAREAE